jgi:excisionase family DNA binding protein
LEANVQVDNNIEHEAPRRASRRPHIKPLAVPVKEACRIGGFGNTTAYELIKKGTLKTKKIGTRRLVIYSSLEALLTDGEAA